MVRKRDGIGPEAVVPDLASFVEPAALIVTRRTRPHRLRRVAAGSPFRFDDYEVGEKIDHVDGVTLSEPST